MGPRSFFNLDHTIRCLMIKYYRVLKLDFLVIVRFSLPYSAAPVEFIDLVKTCGHNVAFNIGSGWAVSSSGRQSPTLPLGSSLFSWAVLGYCGLSFTYP